ncbi:MAG: S1 RNA-binding domain-containing protein [Lachnospiraceae bacterium]|nr:S1 RNA-binding domain-containing protein [Lachnospiraceae bacterium]
MENDLSMKDFEQAINSSFKKLDEGDIVDVTVIGVTDTEVMVDLGYYTEGIIPLEELSNNPQFSIKADIHTGDAFPAYVLGDDDKTGNIILSKKKADDVVAWDILEEALNTEKIYNVKIYQTTNAGVIAYLEGIRGFIPASQLSLSYEEDLEKWVGKHIDVVVITADRKNKKLVLSAKNVLRNIEANEKVSKIQKLQKGIITKGIIEKIAPYGCFVKLSDGISGLVHISQICGKHIKSPNEVVKVGQEVNVKIIDIKDGKVSLSIKQANENDEVVEDALSAPVEYSSGEEATTSLGSLLKNIKLQ